MFGPIECLITTTLRQHYGDGNNCTEPSFPRDIDQENRACTKLLAGPSFFIIQRLAS